MTSDNDRLAMTGMIGSDLLTMTGNACLSADLLTMTFWQ